MQNGSLTALLGSPYSYSVPNNPLISLRGTVDPDGKFFYEGFSPSNFHTPFGDFGVILRNPDGTLGSFAPGSPVGACIGPGSVVAANAEANSFVFVSCSDSTNNFTFEIAEYIVNSSTGTVTSAAGFNPGSSPGLATGLALHPTGKWLAGVDVLNNTLHVFSIQNTGALTESGHGYATGNRPNSVTFDKSGKFLYVTNGDYPRYNTGGRTPFSRIPSIWGREKSRRLEHRTRPGVRRSQLPWPGGDMLMMRRNWL